jgi:hypothetical protein
MYWDECAASLFLKRVHDTMVLSHPSRYNIPLPACFAPYVPQLGESVKSLRQSYILLQRETRKYRTTFEVPTPTIIDLLESKQTVWLAGHFHRCPWGFPAQSVLHLASPVSEQLYRPNLRVVYPCVDRTVQP